jgi:uncharacterized coiled-coil DUF342 family protein
MSEQLNYNINVTGNASESVGSLKKQLREAQNEVAALSDKFGATSKEAIEAAKRAAELRDRIQMLSLKHCQLLCLVLLVDSLQCKVLLVYSELNLKN